jgi:hypothetical protein
VQALREAFREHQALPVLLREVEAREQAFSELVVGWCRVMATREGQLKAPRPAASALP